MTHAPTRPLNFQHVLSLRTRRVSLGTAVYLLGMLISSCGPRDGAAGWPGGLSEPPPGTASGPSLGPASLGVAPPGSPEPPLPLEVVYKAPTRSSFGRVEIVVTFNQPMVGLGPASIEPKVPITVLPAVKGTRRWVAGDTAKLIADEPLPNATVFKVLVPAGVAALSGSRLGAAVTWSFETPRPELLTLYAYPPDRERHGRIYPDDRFLLHFNQRVDAATVCAFVDLSVSGGNQPISCQAVKDQPMQILVRPTARLPEAATVVLTMRPGYQGLEGPLLAGEATRPWRFQVYGPLTGAVTCGGQSASEATQGCWPMSNRYALGLELMLSEPVCGRELLSRLVLDPPVPSRELATALRSEGHWGEDAQAGRDACSREWRLHRNLPVRGLQRVKLSKGLKDIFGQRLEKDIEVLFKTRGLPPGLFAPVDAPGVREPWHPFAVKALNLRALDAEIVALTGEALVQLRECARQNETWEGPCWPEGVSATKRTLDATGARDRVRLVTLPLSEGLSLVRLSSPELLDEEGHRVALSRAVTVASLGVQGRLSAYELVLWVTALDGGTPVPGVAIEVRDVTGALLSSGKSDARGLLTLPASALGLSTDSSKPPRLHVLAQLGARRGHLEVGQDAEPDPGLLAQALSSGRDARASSDGDSAEETEEDLGLPMPELSSFSAWRGDRPVTVGYISTERGIYRPGETLYAQGALRQYRGWRGEPMAEAKAEVVLLGEARQPLVRRAVSTSRLGVFTVTFELPKRGRLGTHSVELRVPEEKHALARQIFKVNNYREPQFAVSLRTPWTMRGGEALAVTLSARYLFGGAMGGAAYRLGITRQPRTTTVEGLPDYECGASEWLLGDKPRRWHLSESQLGPDGTVQLSLAPPSENGGYPWPADHDLEAEVLSPDRLSVAGRQSVLHWPAERIVAVKRVSGRGPSLRWHLRVVEPAHLIEKGASSLAPRRDTPRAGLVTARVLALGEDEGLVSGSGRLLVEKTLSVPEAGAPLEVPWQETWNQASRVVLVLSTRDPAGREARTATQMSRPTPETTAWEQREETRASAIEQRSAALTVTLDRETYLPGQTARVRVQRRGWSGEALLLVEREQIFSVQPLRFDDKGRAEATLRVEERHAGSVTVRAVGLRQGRQNLRNPQGPLLSATAELRVSDDPFRLSVGLRADRDTYRPGETVKLEVKVKDGLGRGRKAEVVVMAVDEAVLRLTNYDLPDPFHRLFRTPEDGVLHGDLRQYLLPLGIRVEPCDHSTPEGCQEKLGEMGGAGYGAGAGGFGSAHGRGVGSSGHTKEEPRRRFLTTAWHATLLTDETGAVRASFVLPDNLTAYRLMAMAVDAERSAGEGRSSLRVALPLVTLPALPRFLREGDQTQAGVVVYNNGLPDGVARVEAELAGGQALALRGPRTVEVQVPRGSSSEARFPLAALRPGTGTLRFRVAMGEVHDSLELPLRVSAPLSEETASVSGRTEGVVRTSLLPLSTLRPDVGALELRLASTALTGVEDGLEQLIGYPHGCLEQRSSQLIALIASQALGSRFGTALPGDPRALIEGGVRDLLAMQRSDGGFAYWPGESHASWPFGTAWALVALARAIDAESRLGLAVPREGIQRALDYLELVFKPTQVRDRYAFPVQALAGYALALHGRPVENLALTLFKQRASEPLFARALLLLALARGTPRGAAASAVEVLVDELSDGLRVEGTQAHVEERLHDGYQFLLHSDDRSSAMVLLALLHARPRHAMVPRLLSWFLQGRPSARFRNTQEAAFALLAFWAYAEIVEAQPPDFEAGVFLGEKRLQTTRFVGRSSKPALTRVPMATLQALCSRAAQDLVFARSGQGTLTYLARLRYAPKAMPDAPLDRGLSLTRELTVLDASGAPIASRGPRLGDTVLVTLKLASAQARRYLVLEDPLPAGLEALDDTLATSSRTFGAWRAWEDSDRFDHRELRDQSVLFFRDLMQPGVLTYRYLARVSSPGTFVVPPSRVEEMYTPEVFGRTASHTARFAP